MSKRHFLPALLAIGLVSVAGCGGGGDEGPAKYKVTGTVTLDDAPVAGATVTFTPDAGVGGIATAETTEDGTFELEAVKGKHYVTVTKFDKPEGEVDPSMMMGTQQKVDPSKIGQQVSPDKTQGAPMQMGLGLKNNLPKRYEQPKDPAGLPPVDVIEDESKNNFALDLKST